MLEKLIMCVQYFMILTVKNIKIFYKCYCEIIVKIQTKEFFCKLSYSMIWHFVISLLQEGSDKTFLYRLYKHIFKLHYININQNNFKIFYI